MSERIPVSTLADLDSLDSDEIMAGYHSGFVDRDPEPGNNHSRAFWHGWRNGAIDRGMIRSDWASQELANAHVARSRSAA